MPRLKFDRPIAHRGLHDAGRGIIENSHSAFEAAIASGYAIECDVQLSSDGVPFIFHDDMLERLTDVRGPSDGRPIAEIKQLALRGSAVGETPQTLAELLVHVAGRTLLQIEIKQQRYAARTHQMAEAVAAVLRDYDGAYVLESFDPHMLVALRRAGVQAPLGIVTYGYDEPEWDGTLPAWKRVVAKHLLHWPLTRFAFISCRNVSLELAAVRLCRALGMPVTSWTITSPGEAVAALARADQIVFEGFLPASG